MNQTSFIPELKKFIVSTSEKCFSEIGEELKQNSLNLLVSAKFSVRHFDKMPKTLALRAFQRL
jgi:hypothetical protein